MNNIRIAKELIRVAKQLTAGSLDKTIQVGESENNISAGSLDKTIQVGGSENAILTAGSLDKTITTKDVLNYELNDEIVNSIDRAMEHLVINCNKQISSNGITDVVDNCDLDTRFNFFIIVEAPAQYDKEKSAFVFTITYGLTDLFKNRQILRDISKIPMLADDTNTLYNKCEQSFVKYLSSNEVKTTIKNICLENLKAHVEND